MWPLGGSQQQPFSCVLGHFRHGDIERTTRWSYCKPAFDQWEGSFLQYDGGDSDDDDDRYDSNDDDGGHEWLARKGEGGHWQGWEGNEGEMIGGPGPGSREEVRKMDW